jgi:hypothetical protein
MEKIEFYIESCLEPECWPEGRLEIEGKDIDFSQDDQGVYACHLGKLIYSLPVGSTLKASA